MTRLWHIALLFTLLFFLSGCSKDLKYGQIKGDRTVSVAFLPDGENILVGTDFFSKDIGQNRGTISIRNAVTWEQRSLGNFDGGTTNALAVSKDGKQVAMGSNDAKLIRLWNVATGQMLTIGENIYPRGLAFTPSGKELVSSGLDAIRVWNVETKQMRVLYKCSGADSLALSPDGNTVVTACSSPAEFVLLNFQTGEKRNLSAMKDLRVGSFIFSPDGRSLALTAFGETSNASDARTIRLLNVQTGDLKILGESEKNLETFTFSPDGKSLAVGEDNGAIRIWNVESKQSRVAGKCEKDSPMSLSFSPDGRSIAVACNYDGLFILKI